MSSVDPDAEPTSSGWILQPGRQDLTATATSSDGFFNPSQSSSVAAEEGSLATVSPEATQAAAAPAAAHEHQGDGGIEENLHEMVEGLDASA